MTSVPPPDAPAPGRTTGVVRMDAAHAPLVAEFLRQVWDPEATPDSVLAGRRDAAATNTAEPGQPPPSFLFLRGERVLGYVTTLPCQLWSGGREHPAYWMNGLMVLPEFRSGPVGYTLVKSASEALPVAMAISVAPPARRLFEALGFRDVGTIPNAVRVIRPRQFLTRLDLGALGLGRLPRWLPPAFEVLKRAGLTPVMAAALRGLDAVFTGLQSGGRRLDVAIASSLDGVDVTSLWHAARGDLAFAAVRDLDAWRARYEAARPGRYSFVVVGAPGALRAVAVVRSPSEAGDDRLRGIRVATLADLVWRPADTPALHAALRGADAAALALGADALLCSATMPALLEGLRRRAFVPVGGNLHLLVHPRGGAAVPETLSVCHVMRGDACADDVF